MARGRHAGGDLKQHEEDAMQQDERPLYLDYNATTPVAPEVRAAMAPFLAEEFGNPSSGHAYGRRARAAVEAARAQVAALIGAAPGEIVFTSGGTEAANLAIRGALEARPERRRVVTSAFEHPATEETCARLERRGVAVVRVSPARDGRVRAEDVARSLTGDTAVVTMIHAHNELGTLQPIAEIAREARRHGALMHADAAQSLGKVPVNVDALGVDLLSIAGHKLYAPKGVGALYLRAGVTLQPVLAGAAQERALRPGTENVAGIVGLGAASVLAGRVLESAGARMRELRDRLLARLSAAVPGLVLHGHPTERLPNTLFVSFPGVRGDALLAATPEIAASTGSACHSGSAAPAAALLAIGVPPEQALGPVRLSLGRDTTADEVDRAAHLLGERWAALRAQPAPSRRRA
jgi:cysteine desulfurase